jgi:hypothetical protein
MREELHYGKSQKTYKIRGVCDIAGFDTFFFTAWILLGLAMLKSKCFGKIFGALGIVLFGITAVFNIWTAPNPPGFELAPIVSLWVLAVYVQMLRSAKSMQLIFF